MFQSKIERKTGWFYCERTCRRGNTLHGLLSGDIFIIASGKIKYIDKKYKPIVEFVSPKNQQKKSQNNIREIISERIKNIIIVPGKKSCHLKFGVCILI